MSSRPPAHPKPSVSLAKATIIKNIGIAGAKKYNNKTRKNIAATGKPPVHKSFGSRNVSKGIAIKSRKMKRRRS